MSGQSGHSVRLLAELATIVMVEFRIAGQKVQEVALVTISY